MGNVAWLGILAAGWPVLSVLLVGSIVSFAVMIEKWRTFAKIEADTTAFLNSVRRAGDVQKVIAWCEKSAQPLAEIAHAVLTAAPAREDKERALDRVIQRLARKFESHIAILGSIASVAPYVGLLGTTIGIIKAFRAVSVSATGGASVVSLGIAEALVGTAAGLIVAIPALLGYNYFANRLRNFTQDWELSGSEIVEFSLGEERGTR